MTNEEKILNLLETMYSEFNKKFEIIESEIKENRKAIIKVESKLENDTNNKVRALFDNREITNDKLDVIDEKIDHLQFDINTLTMKTAQSDNKIIELKQYLKSNK